MGKPNDPIIKSLVRVVKKSFPTCRIFLFGSRAPEEFTRRKKQIGIVPEVVRKGIEVTKVV